MLSFSSLAGLRGCQWSSGSAGGMWCCCTGLCAAGHAEVWAFLARPRSCLAQTQPVSVCTCLQSCIFCFPLAWCGCLQETQSCSSQQLAALGLKCQVLHSCPKTGLAQLPTVWADHLVGCSALPSQTEPLKHLEGKWNKTALDGELSCTDSASRAQECLFLVQLGILPLFLCSSPPQGFTVPGESRLVVLQSIAIS